MIVTSISTDVYKYYNLNKVLVTKNIYNPVTKAYGVEYVQYFYTKIGSLEPSKPAEPTIDKMV